MIAKFNYAGPPGVGVNKPPGDYEGVKEFLAPFCLIHRVNHGDDDPNNPLKGTPDQVVNALNAFQAGLWPTLEYVPGSLTEQNNWVTGIGFYRDSTSAGGITVDFAYHFTPGGKIDKVNVVKQPGQKPG